MGLFGGKKPTPEAPPGRRRPVSGAEERRPQAFSYYSQRSGTTPTAGRTPLDPDVATSAPRAARAASPGGAVDSPSWWRNRFVITVGVVSLLGLLGYVLTLSTNPKVVPVTTGGNAYFLQDTALYQQTAAKKLSSSLLNLNKLTVDRDGVSADLEQHYPEIARSRLVLPLIGHQPTVYIEPNRPSFILTTVDNGAYLLDDSGRALVSTSQITDPGELSVPTVQDKSGVRVNLGSQALPRSIVSFTEEFLAYLKAAGVDYGTLVLPAGTSELDISIKGTPYFVKSNLMGEARLQAGTFLAAKDRLEKDRVVPAQYIDVRVPDRAYYK